MKRWVLWIIIATALVIGGVYAVPRYLYHTEQEPDLQSSLVTVKRGNITKMVSATGFLSSQRSEELAFGRAGRVKQIMIDEGDYVREGQILAKLEDEEERFSLLQAENALEEAKSELEAAKVSSSKNVIEERQRQVKERELELQLRKKDLEDTILKAPFSGVVSKIYVNEGEIVSASKNILRLIDTSKLFVDVSVDEVDISQVRIGQRARITVDAYPDEVFHGKVVYIAPETTTSSGLVVVETKIELEKADSKLKPGFTANADIIVGEARNVLLLPVEAVNERGMKKFAVVMKEGKPSLANITVGISDDTYVEIKSGLKEGELVLSSGLQNLIEVRRKQKEAEKKPQGPVRFPLPRPTRR